jgi:tetratricopeptide (TPR) repeat protein
MFARLLLIAALAAPLAAQDADDVTKFLTEFRAKYASRDDKTAKREWLAELTKRVATTTDRAQKAGLYYQLAMVNKSLDDLDAAIAAVRMAHDLAPESGSFAPDLALLLAANHQNAEASAILGADATNGEALVRRAGQLIDDGEKDLAVGCLQLARKLLPDDAGVDDRLAIVYLRAERPDDAIRSLNLAASKAPESALIHLHLAFAFAQKDYRDYARGELNKALERHPSDDVREGIEQLRALLDTPK